MFTGKKVLITGGSGSWGQELTRQLLKYYNPAEIRIYSRSEPKQVEMAHRFKSPIVKFMIGDVRDKERLFQCLKGVDYVFHMAALKHVPVCEVNTREAVLTNIMGTQNLIEAAIENNVKKVIFVSTDKACDPLNLYGTTKAVAEKLIISANVLESNTAFTCIRGGNVLGTAWSVVPLFRQQIRLNNEITLTDASMTRFFMTLEEAIGLLFRAAEVSIGGEIFVIKMDGVKITDLSEVMVKELGDSKTKIRTIGIRPGEKIDEVLVSRYEAPRTVEDGRYFVILPHIDLPRIESYYSNRPRVKFNEFNSRNTRMLNKTGIKNLLQKDGWFGDLRVDPLISKLAADDLKFIGKKKHL